MELYIDFFNLLKTYTQQFYKNMLFRYINKPNYLEFIYLKGLFLLKNIYSLLLFNCIDRNEIISILEKAYIYFIEFLIQININTDNFELTLKDAVMFTYKKTILSYKQTNYNKYIMQKEFDNNLNILCNIFYIVNNENFIEYVNNNQESEDEYSNIYITNKLNAIKTLENKLLKSLKNNNDLQQLNEKILDLKDNMEKTIETLYNDKSHVKNYTYNINMLNNIYNIL